MGMSRTLLRHRAEAIVEPRRDSTSIDNAHEIIAESLAKRTGTQISTDLRQNATILNFMGAHDSERLRLPATFLHYYFIGSPEDKFGKSHPRGAEYSRIMTNVLLLRSMEVKSNRFVEAFNDHVLKIEQRKLDFNVNGGRIFSYLDDVKDFLRSSENYSGAIRTGIGRDIRAHLSETVFRELPTLSGRSNMLVREMIYFGGEGVELRKSDGTLIHSVVETYSRMDLKDKNMSVNRLRSIIYPEEKGIRTKKNRTITERYL